jgi:outer membrane immunogenic protein
MSSVSYDCPSLAADLAPRYKAPPVAAPVMIYNWSGCYIGGNVGGGWKRNTLTSTTTFPGTPIAFTDLGSDNGSSVIGGAQNRLRLSVRRQLSSRHPGHVRLREH